MRGTFRGLFIGIDRYASDAISWLSCAERDASGRCCLGDRDCYRVRSASVWTRSLSSC